MTHEERARRRAKIAEAVKRGELVQDIAEQFGVCANTVYTTCPEAYLHRTSHRRKTNPFAVLKVLLAGASVTQAAEKFGIHRARVSQIKRDARDGGFEFP